MLESYSRVIQFRRWVTTCFYRYQLSLVRSLKIIAKPFQYHVLIMLIKVFQPKKVIKGIKEIIVKVILAVISFCFTLNL